MASRQIIEKLANLEADRFTYDWDGVCNCCGKVADDLAQTGGNVLLCRKCLVESNIEHMEREEFLQCPKCGDSLMAIDVKGKDGKSTIPVIVCVHCGYGLEVD
jgi:hypothetical protein